MSVKVPCGSRGEGGRALSPTTIAELRDWIGAGSQIGSDPTKDKSLWRSRSLVQQVVAVDSQNEGRLGGCLDFSRMRTRLMALMRFFQLRTRRLWTSDGRLNTGSIICEARSDALFCLALPHLRRDSTTLASHHPLQLWSSASTPCDLRLE